MIRVLSLGAGVQSTAMALMAAHGELGPMPDFAVFADTQAEPCHVYEHLDWLASPNVLPFPIYRVTAGNLETAIGAERPHRQFLKVDIPAFIKTPDGSVALINRSCTRDFKIDPIRRRVREILGIAGKRSPLEAVCEQWIGISTDEAARMKPSREPWQRMRWPLIEAGLSRWDCLRWMERHGYPQPKKSSCVFCPYHSDAEWRALTREEFDRAVAVDRRLRDRPPEAYRTKGILYLHRSGVPLENIDFTHPDEKSGQLNMFVNECEGMCGL